jgi:CRISPR-associated protein Cmx8
MAGKKTKQIEAAPKVLELDYQLAELPSSQHRAGLAGLVLMVDWLKRQPNKQGICEITRVDTRGATLKINQPGLEDLFNEVYAASREEQERPRLMINSRTKEIIPFLREEKRQTRDAKGRSQEKTVYIYPKYEPKGAYLLDRDPSANGNDGIWIRLWRDMMWTILRKKPTTRTPFKARAEGKYTKDAEETWNSLLKPFDYTVDLPSTYFLGARSKNAENVPSRDRARFKFLLHFWPYVVPIYVPAVINNDDKLSFVGYAFAIPDIANLEWFCKELPNILRYGRGTAVVRFRPHDCVVDLAIEGAMDFLSRLRERLTILEGERSTSDLVFGVDVIHIEETEDDVAVLGTSRLLPEASMIDQYQTLRHSLWNSVFRKHRILNLINGRPWYAGFDELLSRLPQKELFSEQSLRFKYFRHDVRESFSREVMMMNEARTDLTESNDAAAKDVAVASEGALIYRMVGTYLSRKLRSKYQLEWKEEWKNLKDQPPELARYEEMKEKVARDAFLAIRSRTGQDFVDYFASTLCSVSQHMNEEHFIALSEALLHDPDRVRTLTMLALSARS